MRVWFDVKNWDSASPSVRYIAYTAMKPSKIDREATPLRPEPLAKDLVSAQHERPLIKQAVGEQSPTSVFAPSSYAEKPPPLDRTMVRASVPTLCSAHTPPRACPPYSLGRAVRRGGA